MPDGSIGGLLAAKGGGIGDRTDDDAYDEDDLPKNADIGADGSVVE